MGRGRGVVIAGRGAVTALGAGHAALVEGVQAGRSGVRPRERSAAWPAPTSVAAEVPADCLPGDDVHDAAFALARDAAREALAEAAAHGVPPGAVGLVLASTKADLRGVVGDGEGQGRPAPLARRLADELGLSGVRASVSTACASGLVAIGLAARRIAAGEDERLLVVGVDALSPFILAGFGSVHALDPEPCRPFDAGRRGISLGEAAGAVLLSVHARESLGVAIAGHGGGNDASHPIHPDARGAGLGLAVRRALACADCAPADVDLVHVHGTGTEANDAAEARGLADVWGGRTAPAWGSKAQTGHTLGAAGVIETLLAADALLRRRVPANVGLGEPGVDPRLDLVRAPRELPRARRALKVASGFGGIQAALVLQA